MKLFKTLLSLIALVVAALGVTQATGGVKWNPALVDLITSGGAIIGTFGIAPFALSLVEQRVCASIATFAAAATAAHASGAIPGAPKVFNIIAAGAAVLAVLGRWQAPAVTPPTPPVA